MYKSSSQLVQPSFRLPENTRAVMISTKKNTSGCVFPHLISRYHFSLNKTSFSWKRHIKNDMICQRNIYPKNMGCLAQNHHLCPSEYQVIKMCEQVMVRQDIYFCLMQVHASYAESLSKSKMRRVEVKKTSDGEWRAQESFWD